MSKEDAVVSCVMITAALGERVNKGLCTRVMRTLTHTACLAVCTDLYIAVRLCSSSDASQQLLLEQRQNCSV